MIDRITAFLIDQGQCDARGIERARRVADESGQRLDAVLIQLGLLTERDLAAAFSKLLGIPVTTASRYPDAPLFPERLNARFLRQARALPLAVDDSTLTLAAADPLDRFLAASVAAATGCAIELEVAVPIELDAALDRLYPDKPPEGDATEPGAEEPLE